MAGKSDNDWEVKIETPDKLARDVCREFLNRQAGVSASSLYVS